MSGTEPDDRAALYVLGALNAEEMRAVRLAAARDDGLAADITKWERRLAPLTQLVDPVEPPPTLWSQLESRVSRITGAPEPVGEIYRVPQERAKSRRRSEGSSRVLAAWRGAALGAMALAAGLAAALWLRQPPPAPQLAMVMPLKPGEGGWLLQVLPNGEIHAQAQKALPRGLQQDWELWALPEGADHPTPLGILPETGSGVLKTAGVPGKKVTFLVSLEPKGGSPTGLPTGPVMFGSEPVLR